MISCGVYGQVGFSSFVDLHLSFIPLYPLLLFRTWELIPSELSHFIANASINKVHGIVETTRPPFKIAQYETVVKQGDVLLNSVQRLSKVLY